MPDWIENRITIRTGSTEGFTADFLNALLTPVGEDGLRHLDFEALKPCPGGYDGDWYMKHIGTDRGAQAILGFTPEDLTGDELVLTFLSATTAPTQWIKRLAVAFPDALFRHLWVEAIRDGMRWEGHDYQGKRIAQWPDDIDFKHPDHKLPLHLTFREPLSGLVFATTELARSYDSGSFDGSEPVNMLFWGGTGEFIAVPGSVLLGEPIRITQLPESIVHHQQMMRTATRPPSKKPLSKAAKKKAAQKARRLNRK